MFKTEEDTLAQIKEELIEINPELELITSYCVIVEKASLTLHDLFKIWQS